jgi:hypothetical protein
MGEEHFRVQTDEAKSEEMREEGQPAGHAQNAVGMVMVLMSSLPVSVGWSMVSVIGSRVPSLQTASW